MRAIAVLLAACCVAGSFLPRVSLGDEKAVLRAMEQQRKAAEAQMRQQAEYERKLAQQQQRMMQEQMKAQQKFAEQQQKMLHEQQKAMQNQQKALQGQQNVAKPNSPTNTNPNPRQSQQTAAPHVTTTGTSTPVYHATRPYYGHAYGYAYHRTTFRNYRTMPTQVDPQTRALLRLKSSLDSVQMGSPVTSGQKTAIKRGLMGVVMVPKVPSITSLETLSGHLANGLANRTSAGAQTGPMALTLMGALNSTELANSEVTEIMNEHRNALKVSKVRPADVTPIMEALRTVSSQVRARR